MLIQNMPLRSRFIIAGVLSAISIAIVVLFCFQGVIRLSVFGHEISRTQIISSANFTLWQIASEYRSARIGYMTTGDPNIFKAHNQEKAKLEKQLTKLKELAGHYKAESELFEEAAKLVVTMPVPPDPEVLADMLSREDQSIVEFYQQDRKIFQELGNTLSKASRILDLRQKDLNEQFSGMSNQLKTMILVVAIVCILINIMVFFMISKTIGPAKDRGAGPGPSEADSKIKTAKAKLQEAIDLLPD